MVELRRLKRDIAAAGRTQSSKPTPESCVGVGLAVVLLACSGFSPGDRWPRWAFWRRKAFDSSLAALLVSGDHVLAREPGARGKGSAELAANGARGRGITLIRHASTPAEMRRFTWLGITAGIVEELIFRGYLVWYFSSFVPLWAAIVITAVAFGIGHAYQGIGWSAEDRSGRPVLRVSCTGSRDPSGCRCSSMPRSTCCRGG